MKVTQEATPSAIWMYARCPDSSQRKWENLGQPTTQIRD